MASQDVDEPRAVLQSQFARLDKAAKDWGLRYIVLFFGAAICAAAAGGTGLAQLADGLVAGALASAAAGMTFLERLCKAKEHFTRTRSFAGLLQYEGQLYDGLAPPYDGSDRQAVLAATTAELVLREQKGFMDVVAAQSVAAARVQARRQEEAKPSQASTAAPPTSTTDSTPHGA